MELLTGQNHNQTQKGQRRRRAPHLPESAANAAQRFAELRVAQFRGRAFGKNVVEQMFSAVVHFAPSEILKELAAEAISFVAVAMTRSPSWTEAAVTPLLETGKTSRP
ncbi:MAG: hypothetical protein KGJ60_07035 [Verrucomicrobiota bacterium]|nr:hypothetical protein [Verrucomicrobiota bacterium]